MDDDSMTEGLLFAGLFSISQPIGLRGNQAQWRCLGKCQPLVAFYKFDDCVGCRPGHEHSLDHEFDHEHDVTVVKSGNNQESRNPGKAPRTMERKQDNNNVQTSTAK